MFLGVMGFFILKSVRYFEVKNMVCGVSLQPKIIRNCLKIICPLLCYSNGTDNNRLIISVFYVSVSLMYKHLLMK